MKRFNALNRQIDVVYVFVVAFDVKVIPERCVMLNACVCFSGNWTQQPPTSPTGKMKAMPQENDWWNRAGNSKRTHQR